MNCRLRQLENLNFFFFLVLGKKRDGRNGDHGTVFVPLGGHTHARTHGLSPIVIEVSTALYLVLHTGLMSRKELRNRNMETLYALR